MESRKNYQETGLKIIPHNWVAFDMRLRSGTDSWDFAKWPISVIFGLDFSENSNIVFQLLVQRRKG